jgi:hypothetical protein
MIRLIKFFQLGILSLLVISPSLALAQSTEQPEYKGVDQSITRYLCTPSENPDGNELANCVNKGYKFGIAFGAIALVFFIVFAGYMYITGGETGKGKAKGMLQNAVIGMLILLGSYVILGFINPNLLKYKSIQPPIYLANDLPLCSEVGLGDECVLPNDPNGTTAISNGNGGGTAISPCKSDLVKVKSASINVYFGKDPIICPGLLAKMVEFNSAMKSANIVWGVTATVEGGHADRCHKSGNNETGTCFDMDVPAASGKPDLWEKTCQILKQVGLNMIVNESRVTTPTCGVAKRFDTSKGDSLHINYAGG